MQNLTPLSQGKTWSREATSILINTYKEYECMWKTTSPFYRNKDTRNDALKNIATAVNRIRLNTTIDDIKCKINGIRTQYVSEINKLILASNRGEVYKPTLWCFNILNFLKPYTQSKLKPRNDSWCSVVPPSLCPSQPATIPNPIDSTRTQYQQYIESSPENHLSDDNDIQIIEDENPLEEDKEINQVEVIETPPKKGYESRHIESENVRRLLSSEIVLLPKSISQSTSISLKRKCDTQEKIRTPEVNTNDEDKISIFGKFVISQMRVITDKVLLMKLEHAIQNAIIEAQLKQAELDEAKNKYDNSIIIE